ncbi:MAG: TetR/AcrR family transcriptional regulator [Gallicola sp.]|nr:TetR/AcrR family transcriptional regulator [Gallicola sp.]
MEEMSYQEKIALQKKQKQRARITNYFLEAAIDIIEKEGVEAVTIRKVADIAGFNSATLYNYFDDLPHLLFLASMTYLQEYIDGLPAYIKRVESSEDLYLKIWNCFIDYSFLRPDIYYTLFFSDIKCDMDTYVSQYYSLFPLDVKHFPREVQNMLKNSSIRQRSQVLIDLCVEEGFVKEEAGPAIVDITTSVYESMLMQVQRKSILPGVARELCMKYVNTIYFGLKGYS